MTTMNKMSLVPLVSLIMTVSFVFGQETTGGEETFLGIGSGSRKIARVQKAQILPHNVDSTMKMEEIKYYLEPKQLEVSYQIENISPARLKIKEPLDELQNGYVKAGAGMYLTPFLEVNYASNRSKYESWGVKGNVQSSFADIKEMGNTRYSDISAGGFFQKFFLDNDLWAEVNYERNNYQFYGLNYQNPLMESFEEADSLFAQNYDFFDVHVQYNSRNTGRDTNKLRYRTWLDYHHLNSNYGLKENYALIGAHSGWVILDEEFLGTFEMDINNLAQPTLSLDSDNLIQVGSIATSTTAIVRANPHIYSRKKNLIAKVGISLQAEINNRVKPYFFPDIEVSYSLFKNVFIPYGGLKGNVQRNTFNDFRSQNPFVSEDAIISNTIQRYNLFAGIRGSLSSKFTFNVSSSMEKLDGFNLFVPDTISSYENKFQLDYQKVNRTTFLGELTYQESEKLKIAAKGEYFIYNLTELEGPNDYAWQRPDLKFSLSSILDLSDKIIIRGDVYLIGTRNVYSYMEPYANKNIVLDESGEVEFTEDNGRYIYKLKPFIDMNLSAEYRYSKKISAFIQLNNFTAKKYQYWSNFPSQSINVFGGVTLSF